MEVIKSKFIEVKEKNVKMIVSPEFNVLFYSTGFLKSNLFFLNKLNTFSNMVNIT